MENVIVSTFEEYKRLVRGLSDLDSFSCFQEMRESCLRDYQRWVQNENTENDTVVDILSRRAATLEAMLMVIKDNQEIIPKRQPFHPRIVK